MSGKYALIIGNTEYVDPGLAQLTAPGKDVEDFARVIKDTDICAFDDVRVLLNELSSSVIEAIDEFFDQKKPDDLLVLYFSGHGVRDELGALYLAAKNTIRTRLRSTAVKSDYIRDAMNQSRSKRQVIILDCCNSGAFPQGTKAEVGGTMGMISAFQGYGRYVLTASDEVQFAWEGNKIIGETDNSLFTHFLLKGLEGEADSDSDGRITVDELYDYAYEQISRVTPKQTPRKDASKQEGDIVLRQFTRVEDIKPVALPDDLVSEIEDTRPYVREAAVQKLEKILKGKNIGMARSAVEALENIVSDENTTRRVAQMAMQALETYRQVEQKAEEERRAKEEAERLAILKAEEERLAREKAEAERKTREEAEKLLKAQAEREAREESERLAAQKAAEEERIAKAKLEADRLAEKKRADEKAKAERKAREEAKYLAAQKAEEERIAEEIRRAKEKAEAERRKAQEEAGRTAKQKTENRREEGKKSVKTRWSTSASLGIIIIMLAACGIATLNYLIGALQSSAREKPQATNTVKPQASRTAIAKSTNTSIASSTNTAIVRSTNTVIVKSTNTANILEFGPKNGSLKHEADDKIETGNAGIDLRDFVVTATFTNPYPATTSTWDYGFTFRNESTNAQYRLIIRSDKKWELKNRIEGESSSTTIQTGQLTNLNISTGGSNTIWLYCNGNKGILYVNGSFIADLDLSARMNSGDVKVAIGFYNGSEIEGYSTEYKDFKVEGVLLEFGPKNGSLKHEQDSNLEVSGAGIGLRDFIVTTTFANPYPTTTGAWDYGFLFRWEDSNNQYRLIISSNKKWELKNRIEGESSSITVQDGLLTNLNLSTGGSNTIWLYCYGDKGILYVNGAFVADLDLSARMNSGDVKAAIGFYNSSEIEGYSTDYKDFTIWKIP